MEKVLIKLLNEGAKQLIFGMVLRNWKFTTAFIVSLVYGVNAFLDELPKYINHIEKVLEKNPFVTVVIVLGVILYISEKALKIGHR